MFIEQLFETPKRKVGEKYHEDAVTARVLISQGYAKRIDDSTPHHQSTAPPFFATAQWSIVTTNDPAQPFVVLKKIHSENLFYDAPPKDCPEDVAAQWRQLTSKAEAQRRADLQQRAARR